MSGIVNKVVEVGSFGLVKDVTGVEGAQDAAKEAGRLQSNAALAGVDETRRQFDVTQENLKPFQEAGVSALAQQQALLGLSGQDAQSQAFAGLNESSGQRFLREREEKALLRNQAAIGGLGGGNVRTALQQQAIGFAQQDIDNQFSRLGQLAGQGQAATTNLGQFGAQSVAQQNQGRQLGAEARASGLLGAAQAETDFTNQLLSMGGMAAGAAASDERLKKDIKKISEDENGNLYEFRYKGEDKLYIGRMAQELREIRPDAVLEHDSGYLMVTKEFAPVEAR